ncbi:ChaC-like protein [Pseudooceanicola batsensis HTCC2597]|uniref:glutathione-specific gamma-glutamylcyclotransferase n=1 Tax=Pseudooceanicola batsensis (strain ATCC BAA-863 / DSM 15984 / KCTC 12145 / HTCC2597) TaxID=252305 RepID=A3TUW6_PSEBH|nr:gamma-glutamylcyclotransferase [Pseudooceanicola batsensis]EAQ04312.1 ChaC-like protein [Pseudooceanicola batsensis HTCC2597]
MWVFGYGSLIWNPEFTPAERVIATLYGYQRSFCMSSIHHRGSEAEPGLVLALDAAPEASCLGVAFRLPEVGREATLAALRERELVSSAYREEVLPLKLADGRMVEALAYVVDREHRQYCGALTLEEQAVIIARARGGKGPNRDYLWQTAEHLGLLGIADADLDQLSARVRDIVDNRLA